MKNNFLLTVLLLVVTAFLVVVLIREDYPQQIKETITGKEIEASTNKDTLNESFLDNLKYRQEMELYKYYKKKGSIVMLGNSLTHRCNWNELLNRSDIINRGIESDITKGFLNRINHIIAVDPEACFIMGGVVDLGRQIDPIKVNQNLHEIIRILQKNGIEPVVQSLLFVAKDFPGSVKFNVKIKKLNELLETECLRNKIRYIDLNDKLGNEGFLKESYSLDGIHITGIAYQRWGEAISPVFEEILKDSVK